MSPVRCRKNSLPAEAGSIIVILAVLLLVSQLSAHAAEQARQVYLLGSKGPMAGALPPSGTYLQNTMFFYGGDAGPEIEIPDVGRLIAGVKAKAVLDLPIVLWVTDHKILGGDLAFAGALPFGQFDIEAGAELMTPGGLPIAGTTLQSDVFTVGDPIFQTIIGWHAGEFHWNVSGLVNVPVGDYNTGRLANISFNRWAADVSGAVSWLDAETGIELTTTLGYTFNGENPATDYETGDEFHAEWGAFLHLSETTSIGVVGYHYQQVTGDAGTGAVLGDFKGQTNAIGGAFNHTIPFGEVPVTMRVRGYHEYDVENRLSADVGFFDLVIPLGHH